MVMLMGEVIEVLIFTNIFMVKILLIFSLFLLLDIHIKVDYTLAFNYLKQGGINSHDKKAFETHLFQFKNFKDFVLNGLNEKLINEIIHFTPQSNFICDARNNILIDFVGKYENIANDIIYIENKINFSLSLPHLNKSNLNNYK